MGKRKLQRSWIPPNKLRLLVGVIFFYLGVEGFILFSVFTVFTNETENFNYPDVSTGECFALDYESVKDRLNSVWFYRNFISKNRPVVLKGGIKHWPAIQKWTIPYLKEKLGDTMVDVAIGKRSEHFGYNDSEKKEKSAKARARGKIKFTEFADFVQEHMYAGDEAWYLNLQKVETIDSQGNVVREPRDLASDFMAGDFTLPTFMEFNEGYPEMTNFWMGPHNITSRAHFDSSENLLCQVAGKKKFVLFPPSESIKMYPPNDGKSPRHFSQVDMDHLNTTRFPLFPSALRITGDILYVPTMWWHQVYSYEFNLAMNFWYKSHRSYFWKIVRGFQVYLNS